MTRAQVAIDDVRLSDGPALDAMFARCSIETIYSRFFTGMPRFPRGYVEGTLAGPPAQHDALVLRYDDGRRIAGLASFVVDPHSDVPTGELGVLLQDDWQRRGYGARMIATLLDRAAGRGVEQVVATVLAHRMGLLRSLARQLELVSVVDEDDYLTARYRILGGPLGDHS